MTKKRKSNILPTSYHELPHLEMEWTPQELVHLAKLAASPPAQPNEKLKRLMQKP